MTKKNDEKEITLDQAIYSLFAITFVVMVNILAVFRHMWTMLLTLGLFIWVTLEHSINWGEACQDMSDIIISVIFLLLMSGIVWSLRWKPSQDSLISFTPKFIAHRFLYFMRAF